MASNVTRDHHNLRRNLKLNSKYISNDGGDEGISIVDAGGVKLSTHLTIGEQALAPNHESHYGKIWINKSTGGGTPNALFFTNESGDDIPLTKGNASVATTGTLAADDILEGDAAISIGTSSGDIVFNNNSDAEWLTFNTNDISDGGIAVSEIVGPDNARLRIRARGHAHNLQLKSENNIDMCVIDNDGAATTAVATFFISSLNTSDKTISGTWVASQGEGTLVSQLADQTAPADQYTGSTSGSDCVVSYLTTGAGNPIFNIYPARGGTGHVAAVTITGCTTADDSSIVTHSTATLTRFMSIRGTGMPTGAYIGSVTDSTHFVIHVDGGAVNATSSGSGRTLTARHRIVFQDAHASGSNYAILEVDTVGSGYIQFGVASSQTDGTLQQRGLISMNNGLTAVGLGIYATNGDLNFGSFGTTNRSCSFEFDAVQFKSSDNFGLPGYMDVRLGDAAFIGDGACNLYRMRLDGTDDNRIFQITATDVSVGDARDADNVIDSSEWNDAGGLTTTVTKTTGDTLINGSGEIKITPKALGGAVEFEKIFTGTDNTTSKLVHIDYDATGNTASGQIINNIALEIDLNSDSQTAVGTVNNTGINIDMVGGTSGVQSNIGVDIAVSGADTNTGMLITQTAGTHLKLAKDDADYATFTVADTGDLTIATVGDGVTDSDLLLDIDGDITLDAAGGDVNILQADLAITTQGTAKATLDMLTLTNTVNAADMDGTGSAIKFNQWYYDGSSPAIEDSGKIAVITENDWTTDGNTRDSHVSFQYSVNGVLAERIRFGRTPSGSDNAVIQGASGDKLIVKSVGTNVPMQISSGAGIELSHYTSFDGTSTTTGSVLKLRILEDFKNPTCDWSSGSTNIDHTATTGGVADDPSDDTLDGQLHIGLKVEAEEDGIPEGAEITGVSSATRVVIDKTTTAVGSNERVTFSPPFGKTILSRYSGTIVAEWEVQTFFRAATTVADQAATGIPAQLRGSTVDGTGTGAIFLYMTNSVGQPIVQILPSGGGSGYITSFTDDSCDYNHSAGGSLPGDPAKATITHDDDDGAIKLYMSVVGEGIPIGSYVGEVVSDTSFIIHRGGGTGSIDTDDRVAVTVTNTDETLTFYERVCIQDADAGGSNYGVVEIYDAKDGVIAFGSHTTSQANQGLSSSQVYFDFNEAGDRFVTGGHFRHLGVISVIDMDTLFLSGDHHTRESGQDYTFIHAGDRMFFGNSTCNKSDIFIDSTSSTRRLWIGASELTNGIAKEGASADWEAAGGLEIAVTNATGATTLDTHTGPAYQDGFAPLTLKPSGDLIFDLYASTTRGLSILYNITADRTTNAEGFYTAIDINFDKDSSTYPASDNTYKGIALDMDNTNATSGTSIMYGIYCTPTLTHSGDGGTPTVIGAYLNATGSSNGTSTSVGLRIDQAAASTADTNFGLQIRSAANTADYFGITVAAEGATKIFTVDADTVAADLTLDAHGDIILDADGGEIELRDGGTRFGQFSTASSKSTLRLYEAAGATTNDYLNIQTVTNGATTIATVDATGTNADLILDAHGSITLDSETGAFIANKSGTEFSVANSAYAGMILGYRIIGEDTGEAHSGDLGTSFATINDYCKVTFKAPPSGNVEITVQAYIVTSSNNEVIEFALSTTDTTSFTSLGVQYEQKVYQGDRSEDGVIQLSWVVTGLTAGAIDTYWLAAEATTGNTRIYWGGDATSDYPVFIMKVTALPAAVTDYAVYG